MIRRPTRSTRTDTLCPYNDALPISALISALTAGGPETELSPALARRTIETALTRCRAVEGGLRIERKPLRQARSEEHTSELQSLMRISYAVFCLKKKKNNTQNLN